jgi:hypothetical protein
MEKYIKIAKEIVERYKQFYTPSGRPVYCGPDPPAPTPQESTAAMLEAYTKGMPGYMEATRAELLPTALSSLTAAKEVAPGYAELQRQIYEQNMPALNELGREEAKKNIAAQAEADASVMRGSGLDLIKAVDEANRTIDPEFYATRAKMAKGLDEMMSGGLTAGEEEAMQRSLNRQQLDSGIVVPTNLNTAKQAAQFGGAARDRLGQALAQATQALPAMRTGMDTLQTAAGRKSVANEGKEGFMGVNQEGYGNQTFGMGQGLISEAGQNNRSANEIQAARGNLFKDNLYATAGSNIGGEGINNCCFILLESYHGTLPWYVRKCRDYYYHQDSRICIGYVRMAKVLVPLMRMSTTVRKLVWHLMVNPISNYGKFLVGIGEYKGHFAKRVWFNIWKLIGGL